MMVYSLFVFVYIFYKSPQAADFWGIVGVFFNMLKRLYPNG